MLEGESHRRWVDPAVALDRRSRVHSVAAPGRVRMESARVDLHSSVSSVKTNILAILLSAGGVHLVGFTALVSWVASFQGDAWASGFLTVGSIALAVSFGSVSALAALAYPLVVVFGLLALTRLTSAFYSREVRWEGRMLSVDGKRLFFTESAPETELTFDAWGTRLQVGHAGETVSLRGPFDTLASLQTSLVGLGDPEPADPVRLAEMAALTRAVHT